MLSKLVAVSAHEYNYRGCIWIWFNISVQGQKSRGSNLTASTSAGHQHAPMHEELNKLLTIAHGGFLLNNHAFLLHKKTGSLKKSSQSLIYNLFFLMTYQIHH